METKRDSHSCRGTWDVSPAGHRAFPRDISLPAGCPAVRGRAGWFLRESGRPHGKICFPLDVPWIAGDGKFVVRGKSGWFSREIGRSHGKSGFPDPWFPRDPAPSATIGGDLKKKAGVIAGNGEIQTSAGVHCNPPTGILERDSSGVMITEDGVAGRRGNRRIYCMDMGV